MTTDEPVVRRKYACAFGMSFVTPTISFPAPFGPADDVDPLGLQRVKSSERSTFITSASVRVPLL